MVYEKRLLLYADILGWSAEIARGDGAKALAAVQHIQRRATGLNTQVREDLKSQDGKAIQTDLGLKGVRVNQMYLEVKFGAFSDHFVWSLPAAYSSRILSVAAHLIIDLLRDGFLTRGAVVLGDLYHVDNVIFGPALLQAVKIEEGEAFYPRILVSDNVVDHCSRRKGDHPLTTMIRDQTGRFIVNPFALPLIRSEEIIASFVNENFFLSEIKSIMTSHISRLENENQYKYAEKWQYLYNLIAGPVFDREPKLRKFWQ